MKIEIFLLLTCLCFCFPLFGQSEELKTSEKDFEIIKQNMRTYLLREFHKSKDEDIKKYLREMNEDGSFKDVDYKSKRRASWPTTIHTNRLQEMAIAFNSPKSLFYQRPRTKETILLAGDFWVKKNLKCPNWYPNIITVPRSMSYTMLLMEDQLSKEQFDSWIKIARRGTAETSGSNLAERAAIQILTACLEKNMEKIEDAVNKVSADTKIHESQGIQSDMSYHYHGTQYYSGGYGMVHARMFGKLLFILKGTRFQLPDEKIQLIQDYILGGERWIFYKNKVDYGAIGRGISRIDQSPNYFVFTVPYIGMIADVRKFRYREVQEFYDHLRKQEPVISGNKHFWKSDVMIHRRNNYYTSVRMYSKNVANAEVCNEEGKITKHLADGMTLIMIHGDEYKQIFPVWDWKRIPGITVKYSHDPLPHNPRISIDSTFVGGVSDGEEGAAVFDFNREGLSVKKAWFYFDDQFICLGSDINYTTDTQILTSINQCLLNGDVLWNNGTKTKKMQKGLCDMKDALWLYHDRIGYFFPEKSNDKINRKIILKNDEQTGNWNLINGNLSDEEIKTDVFNLWIDHGSKQREFENSSYSYIVIPDTSPEKMGKYKGNNHIRILENSGKIQSVQDTRTNLATAVFHQPGSLEISRNLRLSVNSKCLVLIRDEGNAFKIAAANPEPMDSPLIIELNIPLKGENCEWDESAKITKIQFDLPTGDYTGKSVVITASSRK